MTKMFITAGDVAFSDWSTFTTCHPTVKEGFVDQTHLILHTNRQDCRLTIPR